MLLNPPIEAVKNVNLIESVALEENATFSGYSAYGDLILEGGRKATEIYFGRKSK